MSSEKCDEENNEALKQAIAEHEAGLKALVRQNTVYEYRKSDNRNEYDQEPITYKWYIGMIKHMGSWRLCHGLECKANAGGSDSAEIKWKPLADCTGGEQLAAFAHIEKLKQQVAEKEAGLDEVSKVDRSFK